MKADIRIFSTPTADTPGTAVLLQFDQKRYLFGHIAEGTQRSTVEQQIKLRNCSDVFLTGQTEWRTVGGLIGMLLTTIDQENSRLQCAVQVALEKELAKAGREAKHLKGIELRDHMLRVSADLNKKAMDGTLDSSIGRRKMVLHGADNLAHMLGTARYFVFRNSMPIEVDEMEEPWEDELIRVFPLRLSPSKSAEERPTSSGSSTLRRKRSFDMTIGDSPIGKSKAHQLKEVVRNMFASTWTMDTKVDEVMDDSAIVEGSESPSKKIHLENLEPDFKVAPVSDRAPWPASLVQKLPESKPSPTSLSYIIRMQPTRGKFLPHIAIKLGVQPGPDFSRIVKGETVIGKDGNPVTREDCLEPPKPGGAFAMLELPNASYIDDLLSRPEWKDEEMTKHFNLVVWIAPLEVVNDPRITEFMKTFPSNCDHRVSSTEACRNHIAYTSVAKQIAKLNLLNPSTFPLPHYERRSLSAPSDKLYKPVEAGSCYKLLPEFGLRKELETKEFEGIEPPADSEAYHAYLEYVRLAKEASEVIRTQFPDDTLEDIEGKDTEIITLGTGSALPSKYRNVSATMIRRPDGTSLLFDAGENTAGQLARMFPGEELKEIYMKLRAVYISHLHADHHLGTASVLKKWYQTRHNCVPNPEYQESELLRYDRPYPGSDGTPDDRYIYVIAPAKYSLWLREYSCVEDIGISWIRFLPCETYINASGRSESAETTARLEQVYNELGLSMIHFRPAYHCPMSFVTSLTYKDGFKVSYSGDTTAPHNPFADIGYNSTVLIHEATFDDELKGEAAAKKHSTTSQAIEQGRRMNAKHVVLTHFSQRYPKIPELGENLNGQSVTVAFDMMRCKVGHLQRMKVFLPALRQLYAGDKDEDDMTPEEKAMRVARRKEEAEINQMEQEMKTGKKKAKKEPQSREKKSKFKDMLKLAEEQKKKDAEEAAKKAAEKSNEEKAAGERAAAEKDEEMKSV